MTAKIKPRDTKNSGFAVFWVSKQEALKLVGQFHELFPEANVLRSHEQNRRGFPRKTISRWDWYLEVEGGKMELILMDNPWQGDETSIQISTDLFDPTFALAMEYARRLVKMGARPDPSPFRGFLVHGEDIRDTARPRPKE